MSPTFSGSDNGTQEPRMMSQFITDASYPQLSLLKIGPSKDSNKSSARLLLRRCLRAL